MVPPPWEPFTVWTLQRDYEDAILSLNKHHHHASSSSGNDIINRATRQTVHHELEQLLVCCQLLLQIHHHHEEGTECRLTEHQAVTIHTTRSRCECLLQLLESMHPDAGMDASRVSDLTQLQVKHMGRGRFTWHKVETDIDLSGAKLDEEERDLWAMATTPIPSEGNECLDPSPKEPPPQPQGVLYETVKTLWDAPEYDRVEASKRNLSTNG